MHEINEEADKRRKTKTTHTLKLKPKPKPKPVIKFKDEEKSDSNMTNMQSINHWLQVVAKKYGRGRKQQLKNLLL